MYKFISGIAALTLLLVSSSAPVYAQGALLDMQNPGAAGLVPVIRKPITANKTERIDMDSPAPNRYYDTDDETLNVDINRVYSAMGCAALDTQEARRSALDIGQDITDEIYATALGRYMTTTLFANPQNVAVFETLEKYSSDRVRELQDRCAAVEYKDDLAPAQWEAVQQCIQKQTESAMTAPATDRPNEAEALAAAFKACLSGPTYEASIYGRDQNWLDPSINLKREVADVLTSQKWGGTLYNALSETSACIRLSTGDNYCGVLNFIPNFRWCAGTDKSTHKACAGTDDEAVNITPEGAAGRVLMSPEMLSPMQIFEISMGQSEHFVEYAKAYADGMKQMVAHNVAMDIAQKGENLMRTYYVRSLATREELLAGGAGRNLPTDNYGEVLSGPQTVAQEFANYLNCKPFNVDGDLDNLGAGGIMAEFEDFDDITGYDARTLAMLPEALDPTRVVGGDYLKEVPTLSDFNLLSGDHSGPQGSGVLTYQDTVGSDRPGPQAEFVDSAIIKVATVCVMRHDLRLSLPDYLALTTKEDIRDSALLGYRRQVAHQATVYVLQYVIDKLRLAETELSFLVTTDPNSPPPHVRLALGRVIDSLESKLGRMDKLRQKQTDYAEKIAKFHTQ